MPETMPPSSDRPPSSRVGEPCVSCGSPYARWFDSSDGRARLCPTCATLHGLGCP